jgi:hypothetical protein
MGALQSNGMAAIQKSSIQGPTSELEFRPTLSLNIKNSILRHLLRKPGQSLINKKKVANEYDNSPAEFAGLPFAGSCQQRLPIYKNNCLMM